VPQRQIIGEPIQSSRKISKREAVGCETCTLTKRQIYKVNGCGNPKSALWWVGEAPGKTEAELHEPFIGDSGKFHWGCVKTVLGIEKKTMYTANVVRCWPEGNRTPTQAEVKHCIGFLEEEIRRYKPIVIVALGAVPFQALTGLKYPI
jgi:DNA polymerase